MKKIGLFILVTFAIVLLSGCKENEKTTPREALTDSAVNDIENSIFYENTTKLQFVWEYRILGFANSRAKVGSYDSKNIKEYTTVTVTSSEMFDSENYRVYGYFEGYDDFNNPIKKQFYVDFYYEDSGDKGRELCCGNLKINN